MRRGLTGSLIKAFLPDKVRPVCAETGRTSLYPRRLAELRLSFRGKGRNAFGKIGSGLYAVYNTISGYLSDILSYARLLALGLVTGIIGSVVNMMGALPTNKVAKAIVLAVVFVFGHTVNFGINVIGAYVHTNRLQYVEFFSKFYNGGGKKFTPLKANSKTFKFKEEISNG